MSKNNKYEFWRTHGGTDAQAELTHLYINKYYNLWMNKFEFSGLDEDQKEQQSNFIMRKLWSDGTVAARYMRNIDQLVFCPYAVHTINMYDFAESVDLVNLHGVSTRVIPEGPQTVNKDVVIINAQPNRKSIYSIVKSYVDKIVEVEAVINTNLNLQKIPFFASLTEGDEDQVKDIIQRIMNNEIAVFARTKLPITAVNTNTPYIIDKLKQYEVSIENELLTFLGVDNSGVAEKKAQMIVDEVNANNDQINDYGTSIEDTMREGLDRLNAVFGRNVAITAKSMPVDSVSDYEDGAIVKQHQEAQAQVNEEVRA